MVEQVRRSARKVVVWSGVIASLDGSDVTPSGELPLDLPHVGGRG